MARQRFTRHTQPIACPRCGKETTGVEGTKLCRDCFNESELENEHQDGLHDDLPHPYCPICKSFQANRSPNRNDYLVRRQRDRYYLYAFDAWTDDVGSLIGSAKGYDDKGSALHAAQRDAVRNDVGDAVVSYEEKDGSFHQIGNVGTASRHRHRSNSSEQYWVWALGRDRKPLTNEGPWGPYSYQSARSYARISATKGAHDRAVSHGQDPSSASFEIVRVYAAGTGEHKYGMAQRIGAPMAANASPDHELWLCDDCTIVEVNDDPSGIDSDERVEEVYAALHALKQEGHISPDWDSETEEGIKEFSSRRCDSCGTGLAGGRHRFAQWTK